MSRTSMLVGALAFLSAGCAQEIIPYDDGIFSTFGLPGVDTFSPRVVVAGVGETVEITFTMTEPPATATAITFEVDPPTLGEAGAGVVVAAGATTGSFKFVAGDTRQAGTLTLFSGNDVTIPVVVSGLVISELSTGTSASVEDEFIELYNPTLQPIPLDGVALMYRAAASSTFQTLQGTLSGQVPPHGYYLLTRSSIYYSGPAGDAVFGSGLAKDGATVQLLRNGSLVEDQLAWGTASSPPEGFAAAPPPYATGVASSIERKALPTSDATTLAMGGEHAGFGNALDTQDNQHDFVVRAVREPQSAQSGAREP